MSDLTAAVLEYLNGQLSEMAAVYERSFSPDVHAALIRRIERLDAYRRAALEGVSA